MLGDRHPSATPLSPQTLSPVSGLSGAATREKEFLSVSLSEFMKAVQLR